VLSHLDEAAVLLLLDEGVEAVHGHPVVLLDLRQGDPVLGLLDEHLPEQVQQLGGDIGVFRYLERLGADLVVQGQDVLVLEGNSGGQVSKEKKANLK